jgi:prolyl oligopeptidase
MCSVTLPPHSAVEPVTETFHGIPVTDPYRWLEDQDSARTRAWLLEQTRYARRYLDATPGRAVIRDRVHEFLAVETYDSLQKLGNRYFFRKRLPNQEQPCICMREGADGVDQLLIDPAKRNTGPYTAVKPLRISPDGRLLLYEVKEGGERTGTFELLEIETRKRLADFLPRGYLRGFGFAADGNSFYYVHEALDANRPFYRAAYQHHLGTPTSQDREMFVAGEDKNIRLSLSCENNHLLFFVYWFHEKRKTDVYLQRLEGDNPPILILRGIEYSLGLRLLGDRILAITDRGAPNRRIVEIQLRDHSEHEWIDIIPESDARITKWLLVGDRIAVCYLERMARRITIFDSSGQKIDEMPISDDETIRIAGASAEGDEILAETESFTEPVRIFRYSTKDNQRTFWARKNLPFDGNSCSYIQSSFRSKDNTDIPIYLVGRRDVLPKSGNPTIMTAYGGYGLPMTPQFSVLVAFLMERGCLFALPNIRGGSEFGAEWHDAAKRHNRQTAYDDFLTAAKWLVETGRTAPARLAIFGGSNSGLLVAAALTQRPELFCAVLCMVPMADMLRYHLFDNAHVWRSEFGSADDPADFKVLLKYSPYHQIRQGESYPATMIVSGDADMNCNPLHARKLTARLQAGNAADHPIFLDYSTVRGHAPVLPLGMRIDALTDRLAFLCDQLQVSV